MVAVDEVSKEFLRNQALKKRLNIIDKKSREQIITDKILNNDQVITSKNIYVPKVIDKNIKFCKLNKDDILQKGKFGILEPISNDELENFENSVVIVPGLMFDKLGNRLGYGGGYYDRFLENKKIYKIGICFKEFLEDYLESKSHDIKMDLLITD